MREIAPKGDLLPLEVLNNERFGGDHGTPCHRAFSLQLQLAQWEAQATGHQSNKFEPQTSEFAPSLSPDKK